MEITNQLKELAQKVTSLKERIGTEEATKTAFVLPFINILGYDIFNPTEVVPEFTADLGLKKREKVDYAIYQDGQPILIVECKYWKEDLDIHSSQLFRYFHATKTRFALLTNGMDYKFYTDLEQPNKMDEKPFLEFNITILKDYIINEIVKFHKSNFDIDKILDNASVLKYTKEIKRVFNNELQEPSEDFVRHLASQVYTGRFTEKVLDYFKDLVQKGTNQIISERVNDRLTAALTKETEQQAEEEEVKEPKSNIVTTEEEIEGFHVVKAIVRKKIASNRIFQRDTQSYFGVILDDNNRKPICRLHFNGNKKFLETFDQQKNGTRHEIASISDIYNYEDKLLNAIDFYN